MSTGDGPGKDHRVGPSHRGSRRAFGHSRMLTQRNAAVALREATWPAGRSGGQNGGEERMGFGPCVRVCLCVRGCVCVSE